MEVQLEKQGGCYCRMTVDVEVEKVDAAYDKAVRKVAKGARLPGFRAGKVPRALLEKQYGLQIEQEAMDAVVQDSLYDAMQQHKLVPVNTPSLESIELKRNKPCRYQISVEIRPEITVADWKGLAAPTAEVIPDEAAVNAELERMREQGAQTVPVEGRDVVEGEDWVLLDYEGSIDGKPFSGGKAEGVLVEVAGKEYIPGFAEGLRGHKVPGPCTVEVTFPDDFGAEHLRGKQASFAMNLRELKRRELPALDDDFAKDVGKSSLAELRQEIGERVQKQAKDAAEDTQRRKLLEALAEKNPIELPPSMVDRQVERTIQTMGQRMQMYTGRAHTFTEDELADLRSNARGEAEFQVRAGLLISALGEQENLVVDDAAVRVAIDEVAAGAGAQAPQVHAYYQKEDHFEELRFAQLEKRVMQLLRDNAALHAPEPAEPAQKAG